MALKKSNAKEDKTFSEAMAQVEAENKVQIDTGTPATSDDGIVHGEQLLCGYTDPETGITHTTFDYREMDGADEEAMSKGDVRSNGAKLANLICERCVVAIGSLTKKEVGPFQWGKIIRSMLSGDIDYMMFKIRELSKGSTVTFTHRCPKCGSKLVTETDMSDFPIEPFKGQTEIPFTLPGKGYMDNHKQFHKSGVLRLPNGYDREILVPLMMKNKGQATTTLLSRVMTLDDDTPIFTENVKRMSIRDRDFLNKLLEDNAFGISTAIEGIMCTSCGADLSEVQGESDFF